VVMGYQSRVMLELLVKMFSIGAFIKVGGV
jgi:hypothetical protein